MTTPATITKDEWVKRAETELERCAPGWTKSALYGYADSLYETYVDDYGGFDDDPEGAVAEDMTYWD
jgi:hypothetical protein